MSEETPKIYLAVLNITSWVGQCGDAVHVYGNLILSTKKDITVDNVDEWNVKYIGEDIELSREISFEEAQTIDIKEQNHGINQRHWRHGDKRINKFDTFEQVVNSGIEKWKELNLDCPFISLFEGEKYVTKNEGSTVILTK